MSVKSFVGGKDKEAAKRALQQRPCLVLFYMIGCPHCAENKPAWDDAKSKAPEGTEIVEVDMEATPEKEKVEGFPTMKYKEEGKEDQVISGKRMSGDEILQELKVPTKKGGSKRRRRTHRIGKRKLRRRTLRHYVGF